PERRPQRGGRAAQRYRRRQQARSRRRSAGLCPGSGSQQCARRAQQLRGSGAGQLRSSQRTLQLGHRQRRRARRCRGCAHQRRDPAGSRSIRDRSCAGCLRPRDRGRTLRQMDSTIHSTSREGAAPEGAPPAAAEEDDHGRRWSLIPIVIVVAVAAVLVVGGWLVWHAESKINKVALASSPKPVTVIAAPEAIFRDARTYVGTLRPWVEASVGPQYISVYVDTVLVRPGATVKRGDVLATLDCRNASASSQAVAAEARAIDARQQAVAHESARLQTLLDG